MNPLVTYSLARLVLFVAVLGVVSLLGARQLMALLLAAVISLLLSYVLLRPLRDRAAEQLAARAQRRLATPRRPSEDEAIEDAAVDAAEHPVDHPADHPAGPARGADAAPPAKGGSTDPAGPVS